MNIYMALMTDDERFAPPRRDLPVALGIAAGVGSGHRSRAATCCPAV